MLEFLWLVPTIPFLGATILLTGARRLPPRIGALLGVLSVAASAVLMALIALSFFRAPPPGDVYRQELWTWLEVENLRVGWAYQLDALSAVMCLVVTFVGALIHLYSTQFMEGEEGYTRFFGYMNLFVGAMLTLLLAENLVLLYLGWEGVGLCSYLLIGFFYRHAANGRAARKAFVVTRVGDVALAIGIFFVYWSLGTLSLPELQKLAPDQWALSSTAAVFTAAMFLGGAVGKSAQLPLQTWLPDAMAGPTPVSALIHAATMVTAGVYLIARTHVVFQLAPAVLSAVGIIGAVTMLLAGFAALTQQDLKRILAYSTISQIGYMFLGLGVGAWSQSIFHFFTHAFFKALLFLGAGVVILWHHHEHDISRMGGVRRGLPLTFWTFAIGAASLAALPLVTAGYYSKEAILIASYSQGLLGKVLWFAGVAGAFLTALYTGRMLFVGLLGPSHATEAPAWRPRWVMQVPLAILAVFAIGAGFFEHQLERALHTALPAGRGLVAAGRNPASATVAPEWTALVATAAVLAGALLAYSVYLGRRGVSVYASSVAGSVRGRRLAEVWREGWGFDRAYDQAFVRPYVESAYRNRFDLVDRLYAAVASASRALHELLRPTQNGRLRTYVAGLAWGMAGFVAVAIITWWIGGAT